MFVWSCGRGRSAGRTSGRTSGRTVVGGARVVSGAEKKAFDRGGPVWPPRSNAADDRLGGDPSSCVGSPPPPKRCSLAFDRGSQTGPLRSNAFFFGAVDDTGAADDYPTTVRRASDDRPPAARFEQGVDFGTLEGTA